MPQPLEQTYAADKLGSVPRTESSSNDRFMDALKRIRDAEVALLAVRHILTSLSNNHGTDSRVEMHSAESSQEIDPAEIKKEGKLVADSNFGEVLQEGDPPEHCPELAQKNHLALAPPPAHAPPAPAPPPALNLPKTQEWVQTTRVPNASEGEQRVSLALRHRTSIQDQETIRAAMETSGLLEEDVFKCLQTFRTFDADASESISISELSDLMEAMGESIPASALDKLMAKVDADENGKLDFQEFLAFYKETPLHKLRELEAKIEGLGEDTRARLDDELMSPRDRVNTIGIPCSRIRTHLRKELDEADACLQLPLASLLFLSFCVAFGLHQNIEVLHGVDHAIRFDILENANFAFSGNAPFENGRMGHKNFNDVNNFADFWSWFDMGIVPMFWPSGWGVSEVRTNTASACLGVQEALNAYGYHPPEFLQHVYNNISLGPTCPESFDPPGAPIDFFGQRELIYLNYNSIIGGVRLRQERSLEQECIVGDPAVLTAVYKGKCVSGPAFWLEPEISNVFASNPELLDRPGGETTYLLSRWSQQEVRQELRRLENNIWLSPQTEKVDIMLTTYNAQIDVFTAICIVLFLNRGGHIHKMVEPVSIWMRPYRSWWNYAADCLWFGIVLKIALSESVEIARHCRKFGLRKGTLTYLNWINFFDWCAACTSLLIVGWWFSYLRQLDTLRHYLTQADMQVHGSWADPRMRVDFFDHVESLVKHTREFNVLLAIYPFMIVTHFFKSFDAQPRLAMVTRTLVKSSTDLFHFGVVFATIFNVYAISAHILFGQHHQEFATLGRSVNTVFRILLGDFDWDALLVVGRPQAAIWFWTFMWIVHLIVLNMLLAIVMDVYTDVKGNVGAHAETLLSQACEIVARYRNVRTGEAMSITDVLSKLDATFAVDSHEGNDSEDPLVAVQGLMEIVPGLQETQACDLLLAAEEYHEQLSMDGKLSLTDAAHKIDKLDRNMETMLSSMGKALEMIDMQAGLSVTAASAR